MASRAQTHGDQVCSVAVMVTKVRKHSVDKRMQPRCRTRLKAIIQTHTKSKIPGKEE